jgi:hypothetical protein
MTSQRRPQIRPLKQRRVDGFHHDHRSPRSRAWPNLTVTANFMID